MKTITSPHNQQIKDVAALQTPKGRAQQKRFIAQGLITCSTLIQAGIKLAQIYVTQEMLNAALQLTTEDTITLVDATSIKKISTATTPSGMVAVFNLPQHPSADQLGAGLVLNGISDPGNMGTLIRTAAAMNVKSVVVIEGTDPWSPKVIQATAGTIGYLHIFTWSWNELLENKKNLKLCALVVEGGKKPAELAMRDLLLVVGSEAHGISQQHLATCDEKMTIPMPGKTESLNAAIAGSIALYLAFGR